MSTLAETVTRILDDLSRPEDELGDMARREILSAIGYYESSRLTFNERILTATLSATSAFAFSALVANDPEVEDIWAIDDVKVLYSNRLIDVSMLPWRDYFALTNNVMTTANFPDFYSTFNRTLYVYPVLSANIVASIPAHVKLVTLDGVTYTTNAWLTEGEELIRSRACRMICQRKLDDFEKASMFKQLEDEAYKGMLADAATLQATGTLSPNE